MSFGTILKDLLKEHGLTQSALASEIGYTQRAISKWINYEAEPTEPAIDRIADYFEVSSNYLLGRTNEFGNVVEQKPRFHTTHDEEELVLKFRQLSPVSQITIRRLIDSVLKGEQKN